MINATETMIFVACLDMIIELSKEGELPEEIEKNIPDIAKEIASENDERQENAVFSFCQLLREFDKEKYQACFNELSAMYPKTHRKSDGWELIGDEILAANKTEWIMFLFFSNSRQNAVLNNLSKMLTNKTIRYQTLNNFLNKKELRIAISKSTMQKPVASNL